MSQLLNKDLDHDQANPLGGLHRERLAAGKWDDSAGMRKIFRKFMSGKCGSMDVRVIDVPCIGNYPKHPQYMKLNRLLLPSLFLAAAAPASAAIILGNTITVTSTAVASNGTALSQITNDATGTANGYLRATLTEANKLTVATANTYGFGGASPTGGQFISDNVNGSTFTFTFTGAPTIGEILVWNYSQNDIRGLDAISNVEVNTGTGFSSVMSAIPLLAAGDTAGGRTAFTAQVIDLPSLYTGVTAIRLTVAQGITGGTETAGGFDQVAFSSVPEPSVVLLGGLGLLGLLRRRR